MRFITSAIAALVLSGVTCSCDSGTEWESGDYEVYWIDISSDLTLGRKIPGGNWIGRVEPQVFAVGSDERWIVAGRYPAGDRANPEFFYFAKDTDSQFKNGEDVVLGPFTAEEFDELKQRHGLPEWSKRF